MVEAAQGADGNLYEKVAQQLAALIAQGTFRPGDRIPSVRRLSHQQEISITTCLTAYRLLEDRGLIEARPQSGYYVRVRPLHAEPDVTRPRGGPSLVKIDELVMKVMRGMGAPGLVQLGAASPSPDLLPNERLHRALAAAGRRLLACGNHYCPTPGLPSLRVQIARRMLESGCAVAPDDVLVTCGAQEALVLSLRTVCRPGDTVAIESPMYFGVLQAIELAGVKAVEIATHPREGLRLDALRKVMATTAVKAVFVASSYSNPLGCCMPPDAKRELVAFLAKRDVPLVEDDTFGDLGHDNERPPVFKAYDKKGLVLLCSSFSKTLAPGYRVGWVSAGRYQEEVERQKFVTNVATPTLPQHALADFLANGGYDRHLRHIRRVYARQMGQMIGSIGHHFPPGTKVTRPAGGYVLWVELPASVSSLALFDRALEAGITLVPGPLFSARKGYDNFIRLNAAYWSPEVERAIATLGELTRRLVASPRTRNSV